MTEPSLIEIYLPNGERFAANSYVVQNGKVKELMIYWYQGRGRFVASEYADKFFTVLDSVSLRRSDAAMVRVMTSVKDNEIEGVAAAKDLATKVAANLSGFVPN
jgi:EpsI family protein